MGRLLLSIMKTVVFLSFLFPLAAQPLLATEGADKPQGSAAGAKQISAKDAASLIEKNKNNPGFVILDVRTPGEYSEGHIENALNLDVRSKSFTENASKLDPGRTYLIHCRSGARSAKAAAIMEELGFTDIYDIQGGFIACEIEGLPVAK